MKIKSSKKGDPVNTQQHTAQKSSIATGFRALLSNLFTAAGTRMSTATLSPSIVETKAAGRSVDYGTNVNADVCHVSISNPDGARRSSADVQVVQSAADPEATGSSSEATASPGTTSPSKPAAARHQKRIGWRSQDGGGARRRASAAQLVAVIVTSCGLIGVFATPALAAVEKPSINSESSSSVAVTEARLEAEVNAGSQPTECHFQYGETSVSEHEAICEQGTLEGETQGVGVNLTALTQDTLYHYRVVLKNASGTAEGTSQEFTTSGPEAPEITVATEVTSSSAKLNGVLNPRHKGEAGTYEFRYERSYSQCNQAGVYSAAPEPAAVASGDKQEAKSIVLTGLLPGATYTYCLVVHTASGEAVGPAMTFTALATGATVESGSESFTNDGSASVELHAKVDPDGAPTSYFFEYGSTTAYGFTTPAENAEASSEPVSVAATVEGLQPETEYHFRVVASNASGPASAGPGDSFSTFPLAPLGFPDGRSSEPVSPLENGDATVLPGHLPDEEKYPVRAAANGGAVTYMGTAPPTGGNGEESLSVGIRPTATNVYLANRSAAAGWSAADIQPDALTTAVYEGFSSDLSVGILGSEQALTPGAPNGKGHGGLYSRDDGDGSYDLLGAGASYAGSTPNGSHILFSSPGGLYDSVGGQLEAVSVLPGGEPAPDATFGSEGDLERVISDDGAYIFWTDLTTGDLYVRENDALPDASTVLVAEGAHFRTASSNGSKVFFTDEKPLTTDSTAAEGAPDLYEYNVRTGALHDLSVDFHTGEHANVVGVLGASENGAYIYFAAAGVLANGAVPQECLPPTEKQILREKTATKCNVYVLREGEAPKFVASVSAVDGDKSIYTSVVVFVGTEGEVFGDWKPPLGFRSAHVAANGSQLVFESFENLTGFNAKGGREIYIYGFGSGISCVSCNPSGAPTETGQLFAFAHAELPQSFNATFPLRDLSASGNRVFFLSNEVLTSQDTNAEVPLPLSETIGLTDVYEWEREGANAEGVVEEGAKSSCPVKHPARLNHGCIFLLSGGTSSDISFFIDASESGNDVFIGTRSDLVPEDKGEVFEVYDDHVCTEAEPCAKSTPPECAGTGCQGVPPAPPIFATPASVTFNGAGNFPPPVIVKPKPKTVKCVKGKKLTHGKCVKTAKRKKFKSKRGAKR